MPFAIGKVFHLLGPPIRRIEEYTQSWRGGSVCTRILVDFHLNFEHGARMFGAIKPFSGFPSEPMPPALNPLLSLNNQDGIGKCACPPLSLRFEDESAVIDLTFPPVSSSICIIEAVRSAGLH
jgi:hypothetical protein